MINVICWKWKATKVYRSQFGALHVNTLHSMVQRNLDVPHRFICITDDGNGLKPEIKAIKIWPGPKVEGMRPEKPNCYRRLRMFARDIHETLGIGEGERIISIDLDCVITANVTDIFTRTEDFLAWNKKGTPYQGSFIMLLAGTRPHVWEHFDPIHSPAITKKLGYCGSDQAWISASLGRGNEPVLTVADGLYSYKGDKLRHMERPPENCKMVFFHGIPDPWEPSTYAKHTWIREHWRL